MTYNRDKGFGTANRAASNPGHRPHHQDALMTVDDPARGVLQRRSLIADAGIIPLHFQVNLWAMRDGINYVPRTDENTRSSSPSGDAKNARRAPHSARSRRRRSTSSATLGRTCEWRDAVDGRPRRASRSRRSREASTSISIALSRPRAGGTAHGAGAPAEKGRRWRRWVERFSITPTS
jgi:hypothetical protein